ncbi:MAG: methyltransferase domain-containing protein [Burkholderiales bacterium]
MEEHDANRISVDTFDRIAARYDARNRGVTLYDDSQALFCELLPPGPARVLDAACGPGGIAAYVLARRPEAQVTGIDLAPAMIELARANVPAATFEVRDCRDLAGLGRKYHGIACGFGLPYLTPADTATFIADAARILEPGGALYIGVLEDIDKTVETQTYARGERVVIHYHREADLARAFASGGLAILDIRRKRSPGPNGQDVTDLMIVGRKAR